MTEEIQKRIEAIKSGKVPDGLQKVHCRNCSERMARKTLIRPVEIPKWCQCREGKIQQRYQNDQCYGHPGQSALSSMRQSEGRWI